MRTEQEMYDLILHFAKEDPRVRAVLLNGSRANPNAPKDYYQDFDIVYVVKDFEAFKADWSWLDYFGERLIMQTPEAMRDPSGAGHFNWMMLFADGNRLDLTLIPMDRLDLIDDDSQTVVLLDKDHILPEFPPASDRNYFPKKPDALYYTSCCNNFFWCMQNVVKGIARQELPYAMVMYHTVVREELHDMLNWYIGCRTDFQAAPGKMGKYFQKFLPKDLYDAYEKTYSDSRPEHFWSAVYTACDLFRTAAKAVGECLGYEYNQADDDGIMTYLRMVRSGALEQ